MTKSELIQQALTEYETANGRPATDAVKIAQKLNRKGRSASVEIVPEAKHPILVANEKYILAFVGAYGVEAPLKEHDFAGAMYAAEQTGDVQKLLQAQAAWNRLQELHKAYSDQYHYRDDFGTDTLQREVTTTTETPSRAEVELGDGVTISRQDVVNEMKAS